MLTIIRTRAAARDAEKIWLAIASKSVISADRTIAAIEQKLELLRIFPDSGFDCEHLGAGLQRLVAGNYLIYYLHQQDDIIILRIIDGRRQIKPEMFDRK